MRQTYRTVYEGGQGILTEKKSRFLADVRPVSSEEEALAFIEEMKKKYWDARHNCYAYTVGSNREYTRCSDDGEPSGTAGRPMLDVLLGEDLYNTAVVVTRYFGGVLLGTGGLVRAYSGAVQEGLRASKLIKFLKPQNTDIPKFGRYRFQFARIICTPEIDLLAGGQKCYFHRIDSELEFHFKPLFRNRPL